MRKLFFVISALFISSFVYSQAQIDGFGNIKWGSSIDEVRGNVIGKITYTDEKKVIVSRDSDIEYLYGFLNRAVETGEQAAAKSGPVKNDNPADSKNKEPGVITNEADNKARDTKLYYVSIRFPYLAMDEVKKKIEGKFGPATGEDIKDNKGAVIWNSGSTTIIMWVDSYGKKPFCMKINYISKEISKEVNNYLKVIFSNKEAEVIKKLSL